MYNEDPASLKLFNLLRPIVLQLSTEEKKRLNDWFEDYKKDWFEKADKSFAKSIDIQEEKLSQFLDFIRASDNFSKSTYKDLCHFNNRSTLISTTDHFCLALTSAILHGNVKELIGNHINLNLKPGSEFYNTFCLVFPDYKNKNSVEDEKIKREITTSTASSSPHTVSPELNMNVNQTSNHFKQTKKYPVLPKHPGKPSIHYHFKKKNYTEPEETKEFIKKIKKF